MLAHTLSEPVTMPNPPCILASVLSNGALRGHSWRLSSVMRFYVSSWGLVTKGQSDSSGQFRLVLGGNNTAKGYSCHQTLTNMCFCGTLLMGAVKERRQFSMAPSVQADKWPARFGAQNSWMARLGRSVGCVPLRTGRAIAAARVFRTSSHAPGSRCVF